jgi:hypothetical protein
VLPAAAAATVVHLQALAKYAFGMGSLQVIITTLLFTAVALPAGSGLGTWFLEKVCNAEPSLVSIRSVDEVRCTAGLYCSSVLQWCTAWVPSFGWQQLSSRAERGAAAVTGRYGLR